MVWSTEILIGKFKFYKSSYPNCFRSQTSWHARHVAEMSGEGIQLPYADRACGQLSHQRFF